jgi:hypothetical protein
MLYESLLRLGVLENEARASLAAGGERHNTNAIAGLFLVTFVFRTLICHAPRQVLLSIFAMIA